ncbi:slr1658 superfamily regulator [Brunnivagina elsteri]|uniref:slr1658 superfamily regulator n=1 Tax=Brunnivagina elsteri TaxID=1247191 RepID=UPI001FE5930D|nr:hypothetical protein [Calothrix elsteri]
MNQIFGYYVDKPLNQDQLTLSFSPSSIPIKDRWRNNGLSADFMADYLTSFIPTDENQPSTAQRQSEIKSATSYIANELLENSMKYCDYRFAVQSVFNFNWMPIKLDFLSPIVLISLL